MNDIKSTSLELVHYGASKYDPERFDPIQNSESRSNKPLGGLWASPVASEWGWVDFCERDGYIYECDKSFTIRFIGKVFLIDSYEDMLKLPWEICGYLRQDYTINFEKLYEYDAIHLTEAGQYDTRFPQAKSLRGWDCETVLIMNPNAIVSWCESIEMPAPVSANGT